MKSVFVQIGEAVQGALKSWPPLAGILGGRIYLDRFRPVEDQEYPIALFFVPKEERIETDRHPEPDERRLTFGIEIFNTDPDGKLAVFRAADEIERALILPRLDPYMESPKQAELLKIAWQETFLLVTEESLQEIVGAQMIFELEYEKLEAGEELPDFRVADTRWTAVKDEELLAEDETKVD
jgi:hypothetical protein